MKLVINRSFFFRIFPDYVTIQVDYSSSDDLEEIWESIRGVAKTCSKLNEFAVEGKLFRYFYLWNTGLKTEISKSVLRRKDL